MSLTCAEAAISAAGLPSQQFSPRHGWANEAWIGDTVVVRISSGRLRGALSHEAATLDALDEAIRFAVPVAVGRVAELQVDVDAHAEAEWLVSRRVAGETLAVAWPSLSPRQRRQVGRDLGATLRRLHAAAVSSPGPPWWLDAQTRTTEIHNCYHPPPRLGPLLVDSCREVRDSDQKLLDEVSAIIDARLSLFDDDPVVFAHTDVHAHNLLVSEHGNLAAVLDWEGAHPAAPDVELDMLLRYVAAAHAFPERPGASVAIAAGDMLELVDHVAASYPGLFAIDNLRERLEVYDAHWHLIQLLVNDRLHGGGDSADPAWDRLRLLLDGQSHLATVV